MNTETLRQDMIDFGFEDFNIMINENNKINKNFYKKYLNTDLICWVNNIYRRDFELFNYEMYN